MKNHKENLINKIEKIKIESCVFEIQEAVKDFSRDKSIIELERMLEIAECRIIIYRLNCFINNK